jgi:hypothetical protein
VPRNNLLSSKATYHLQHATFHDSATTQLVNGCKLIKRKLATCGFLVAAYPYKVAFGAAFL